MDAFDFSDKKTKNSEPPSSGLIWKFGTFYFLFGTVCMVVFFLYTFIQPNNSFNPFPPSDRGVQEETPQPTDTPIPPPDTDPIAAEILSLINAYRVESGLSPYIANQTLADVAQSHSEYQASINTSQHEGPGGTSSSQRVAAAGYGIPNPVLVDEMIYSGENATPEAAVEWWKNSQIHNDIMLSLEYQEIGVGVAKSDTHTFYTVNVAYIQGETPPTATSDSPPEDPTETATLDPLVTPDVSTPIPLPHFAALGGSPIYQPHSSGCDGLYIAGNVIDINGNFLLFWVVRVGGTLGGEALFIEDGLSGINPEYTDSGWEIKIANAPIDSNGTVYLELIDPEGNVVSDLIIIDTYDDCSRNLIMVNFIQDR